MRSGRTLALAAVVMTTAACESIPACPQTVQQAETGDFSAIGAETFVAIARVARFVPSPDPDARGYDLGIERTIRGETSFEGIFLRTASELPGIRPGQSVIVVAEPGPNERVIVQGTCVPLQPIPDE
jgi:hypothetical protein